MILKSIKTEHTDEKTGLVVKRITTSEWEHFNRKVAVNNSLFSCEKKRLIYDKPLLNSPFQIHHIPFKRKKQIWDFDGLTVSKAHAIKQKRLYLAFQQRSEEQWNNLTLAEAEGDFQDLATRGLPFVPYSIPKDSSLEKWKERREEAQSILNQSQMLVPIFCSKHQKDLFEEIFNYEFENSKLIGVQCYSINNANTLLNLMKIKLRNMRLQTGDEAPLLFGLSYDKVQRGLSNVSGSFVYSCFGFDVLSHRQIFLENMPTDVIRKILSKKVEEIMRYDKILGGFNLSAEQEFWDGVNVTQAFLENVSVAEGLTPYQAIQWANYNEQQNDFDILNNHILETADEDKKDSALNYIESQKERWAVFWKTKMPKQT
ncbi:hypothetical protein ES703_22804 [subsurface metagenome]